MSGYGLCAIGDSFVEGRGDEDANGGYRGWVPRLAGQLGLRSAKVCNLGAHGATSSVVVRDQLEQALHARAPLTGVIVGVNDLVSDFDRDRFAENVNTIFEGLSSASPIVFTATYPDIPARLPVPESFAGLLRERFDYANTVLVDVCDRTGTVLLDIAADRQWARGDLWSADGLHPNALGHSTFAQSIAATIAKRADTDLAA
jgi:lysophospholipase L1-like esterase